MSGNEGKEGEEGKEGKDKVGEHDRRGKSYLIASLFIQSAPGTGTQVFYQYVFHRPATDSLRACNVLKPFVTCLDAHSCNHVHPSITFRKVHSTE